MLFGTGRNNKLAEEINGLLRTASSGSSAERRSIFGHEDDEGKPPLLMGMGANGKPDPDLSSNLDELIKMMEQAASPAVASVEKEETVTAIKRQSPPGNEKDRQYFWNAFINRYPMLFYPKSIIGTNGFLVEHDPGWMRRRSSLSPQNTGSDLRRHTKSFRLDLRNVNTETGGEGDDATKVGSAGEIRKGGKNFQTQGW